MVRVSSALHEVINENLGWVDITVLPEDARRRVVGRSGMWVTGAGRRGPL
jgi:hypothetical protein